MDYDEIDQSNQSFIYNQNSTRTWVIAVAVIVAVVLLLYWCNEHFALLQPQALRGVYTSGASIRQQSVDSASNRGWNDLPDRSRA